jgi:predicted aconitase with swiveling domain
MKDVIIRPIVEGLVEGRAIVSPLPISFFGDIDPKTGNVVDSENPLYGQSITGKIFVFPKGKGSTVGSYIIYGLKVNEVAPLAFIANNAETIVIAGAILAEIPLVDQPKEDVVSFIKTDDYIKLDTKKKIISKKDDSES